MNRAALICISSSLLIFSAATFFFFQNKDGDEHLYTSTYSVEDLDSDYHANVEVETFIEGGHFALITRLKEYNGANYSKAEIKTTGTFEHRAYNVDLLRAKDIRYLSRDREGSLSLFPITRKKTSVARRSSRLNDNIILYEDELNVVTLSYRNGGQILIFKKEV